MKPIAFWRDETGAVLVEISILLPIVSTILFGSIDFLYAFSDPVAAGLNDLTNLVVLSGSVAPRRPMPGFTFTCDGRVEACTCSGNCPGISANPYNAAAMNRIIFGRGSSSCTDATTYYATGMCDILPSITAANVRIVYTQTGLGYAGRPGGPGTRPGRWRG